MSKNKQKPTPKSAPSNQEAPSSTAWKTWVPMAAAALLYLITLTYPLLGLDDHQATVENKAIVTSNYAEYNLGMYAPLTWAAYAIPYHLGPADDKVTDDNKGRDAGWGYHLLCLLVHVFNTFLVAQLLARLNVREALRFPLAFLFAVHPIQAESVAWVAGFSTPFSALFCLLGLMYYIRYQTDEEANIGPKWYALALVMMVLANLAKSSAVVLPLLMVMVDQWLPSRVEARKRWLGYLPFFALAIAFGLLTFKSRMESGVDIGASTTGFSVIERFLLVCYAPLFYLTKILVPLKLNIYYSYDKVNGALPLQYWVAPVVLAGLGYLCWKYRKTIPGLYIGLGFFLANLSVTLPFATIGTFELCADHYNYLACLGAFFALGSVLLYVADQQPQRASLLTNIAIGWMVIMAIAGALQVRLWKDTITVVSNAIDNGFYHRGMMFMGRGVEYGDLNKPELAIQDFTKALAQDSTLKDAYKFRSTLYANTGKIDLALADTEKYLQYDPADVVSWNNLGMIYMRQNRLDKALQAFNKTIELKPGVPVSYQNRAKIYEMMGNAEASRADLDRAASMMKGR